MATIRAEHPADIDAIRALVTTAFADAPHSSGTEAAIVDGLRRAGALSLSLVAEDGGVIVGHVAFSPVTVAGCSGQVYGLGPVAVRPDHRQAGIGRALIEEGLDRLRGLGARGCVVLGDPAYYGRFGFGADPALSYADVPPEYFLWLGLGGERPSGPVAYHPAFDGA